MSKSPWVLLLVLTCSCAYSQKLVRFGLSFGAGRSEYKFSGKNYLSLYDVRASEAYFHPELSKSFTITADFFEPDKHFIFGFDLSHQKVDRSTGSTRVDQNNNYFQVQYTFLHFGPSGKIVFNPRSKWNVYLKLSPYVSYMLNQMNSVWIENDNSPNVTVGPFADPRKRAFSAEAGVGLSWKIVSLELKGLWNFVGAKEEKGPTCKINTAYASLGFRVFNLSMKN